MRFLITGSAGFIGTHLTRELLSNGHEVVGVDMADGDLREPGVFYAVLCGAQLEGPVDYVIHLAAQVGRLFGEDDVAHTITNNALATARVAQACAGLGVKLAYCSTSEIYGDQGEATCTEDGEQSLPHNLYGLTKRHGEEVAQLYAPDGLVIFRLSMPYGPGLPAGRGRAAMINFLYNAMNGEPLTVHRGAERAWCYVGDTVAGIRMILQHDDSVGAWNIGRDDIAVPMRAVAEQACIMTGASPDLIVDIDPPARQTVVKRLGMDKLRSIGWRPQVELDEGMARVLEWLRSGQPALVPLVIPAAFGPED